MKFKFAGLLITVLMVAGVLPAQAQTFPELTGEYQVGRKVYHLVDETRQEVFTEEAGDQREVMITIHYPTDSTEAVPSPYVDVSSTEAIVSALQLPQGFFDTFESHAVMDAPLVSSQESYPVILFSPGFGNLPLFYTSLLEDLASHGYIVVSMSHTYSTAVTVFPDGRALTANELGSLLVPTEDTTEVEILADSERILASWVGDARFVLDALPGISDADFDSKMDFTRLGMFGHSFGGATSATTALDDERVLAGINMDGSMYGDVLTTPLNKPFMVMLSGEVAVSDEELAAAGYTREQFEADLKQMAESVVTVVEGAAPGYHVMLKDSAHNTYTTDFLVLAQALPGMLSASDIGTIDSARALEVISAYVVGFFDAHVKGEADFLLDAPSADYPEVVVEIYQ